MAVQWFPGHMHLTRQAIAARIKEIDVVLELLDARLPGSSANPLLAGLTRGKPALKVLNKQDLADAARTGQWLAHYNGLPATRALSLDASVTAPAQRLIKACRALAPHRGGPVKPIRVLVCGIPNVGKSTLINTLAGKRAAKTGNEAGITKVEQRINLAGDCVLYDTPGVLWPRIIVARSGYNLAASGAIGRNAFDGEEVALELLGYLKRHYAAGLQARYHLDAVAGLSDEQLLEAIGRTRGALQGQGRVNRQKAAEIVIHDFRSGSLGAITLETPEEFEAWCAEGTQVDAARQARNEALQQQGLIKARKPKWEPKGPRRRISSHRK